MVFLPTDCVTSSKLFPLWATTPCPLRWNGYARVSLNLLSVLEVPLSGSGINKGSGDEGNLRSHFISTYPLSENKLFHSAYYLICSTTGFVIWNVTSSAMGWSQILPWRAEALPNSTLSWYHAGSLKSAMEEVFPHKLETLYIKTFFFSSEKYHQHSTALSTLSTLTI